MPVRFAVPDEVVRWNDLILRNPDKGNVFSSFEYAQQKKLGEYTPLYVIIDDIAITILEKKTPPLGKMWYLPKGPNVTDTKTLFSVLKQLTPFAKKHGAFVVRIESELEKATTSELEKQGLIHANPIIPNPSTITLNIAAPLDELLISLPQKGRYAIKRAERDGVSVKKVDASEKNCKIMYSLLEETAQGQFGIRNYHYFKTFWQRFEKNNNGQLFFAYVDNHVVAGAFAMVFGTKSTYKDGASIRKRTVYGASHLLQWHVIEWAKQHGATLHDFCGSPPSDEVNNSEHPLHGIGLFKTAFSKQVVDYIGCYDVVISASKYTLWKKIGERIFRRLYYGRTKDYYY